ncbi:helix-turn-helix domain-containing protein [Paracidovorax avenae]|uniref:helix-turn-helix domain-containing protein n=1 Tax=Paracidovorax avenae TaxID=80867 RepID=UPI000D1FFB5A|nr:helix-turn-helix transcriptional regulator [Paracidovorax avenae]AVT05053.1 XRE family transcriptional regulator [Paracidovorax avenae]
MLKPEQLPILAGALLRLRGQTLTVVSEATGIRTANLSAWLKGKPQVISSARVTALLHYLGVEGGRLRTDVVHIWADHGEWPHLCTVFNLLQEPVTPRCLYQDDHPGLTKTRFLQWGLAWIRVSVTPSPTGQGNLAALTRPDRVIMLPVSLESIPTNSLAEVSTALTTLAEQGGVEMPRDELPYGFMDRIRDTPTSAQVADGLAAIGWMLLEDSLRTAIRSGMNPGDLANRIALWHS